ncbi:hypothetical protein UFOVP142_50 [uncultured Caudovirales phage]|uniref:Uncharacterized protein n=1 Tax=uncultured Caudovirales phage TaxID=2100421 RepID=A0A6J7XNA5_9CAUD|nr:hypothetical protein UFOVP142_50 [uncultured Caudovirales phage]
MAGEEMAEAPLKQEKITCLGGAYDGQEVWVTEDSNSVEWSTGHVYVRTREGSTEWEFHPQRSSEAQTRLKNFLYSRNHRKKGKK